MSSLSRTCECRTQSPHQGSLACSPAQLLAAARAAISLQRAARNTQRATYNVQHATRKMQHATCNTQRAARNAQQATRSTQRAAHNSIKRRYWRRRTVRSYCESRRCAPQWPRRAAATSLPVAADRPDEGALSSVLRTARSASNGCLRTCRCARTARPSSCRTSTTCTLRATARCMRRSKRSARM
jgi:hypothetical protein